LIEELYSHQKEINIFLDVQKHLITQQQIM